MQTPFIVQSINRAILTVFMTVIVLLAAMSQVSALTIIRNFIAPGDPFPGISATAGAAHPTTIGGGNLVDIFDAAADAWERAILDDHQVTIHFGWDDLPGNIRGTHITLSQGGSPNRETEGLIVFDNERPSGFYMDPNPNDNAEYPLFNQIQITSPPFPIIDILSEHDLGGGEINVARLFVEGPGFINNIDPDMFFDMFTNAMHEIGHALGLSAFNSSFTVGDSITVTSPRPFAGSVIPTEATNPHLFIDVPNHGLAASLLRIGLVRPTFRSYITEVDILAVAEISQFTNLNLNPLPSQQVSEPGTLTLFGIGLAGLGFARRRKAA